MSSSTFKKPRPLKLGHREGEDSRTESLGRFERFLFLLEILVYNKGLPHINANIIAS